MGIRRCMIGGFPSFCFLWFFPPKLRRALDLGRGLLREVSACFPSFLLFFPCPWEVLLRVRARRPPHVLFLRFVFIHFWVHSLSASKRVPALCSYLYL